jgi:alpha-tubulin suppressor-like RCC1 family protein
MIFLTKKYIENIYSYGEGFLGALGTGKYEKIEVPEQLPSTTALKIKEISAGWYVCFTHMSLHSF